MPPLFCWSTYPAQHRCSCSRHDRASPSTVSTGPGEECASRLIVAVPRNEKVIKVGHAQGLVPPPPQVSRGRRVWLINREGDLGEIPLRRASWVWDVLRWWSSSHTEAGLRYTFGERRLRVISPAPSRRSPLHRRWNLGTQAGLPSKRAPKLLATVPSTAPCMRAFLLPFLAGPGLRLQTGRPGADGVRPRRMPSDQGARRPLFALARVKTFSELPGLDEQTVGIELVVEPIPHPPRPRWAAAGRRSPEPRCRLRRLCG